MNGGEVVAEVLAKHGVRFLFTLCGGHISPILVESKRRGIRVVDTRHEANAVFAADAIARLTGVPGVAAVTAGPGVTNTITAIRNARLAQSPLVLLGGAAAGILRGRGALQDIDQMELMRPNVKWAVSVSRVRDLADIVTEAFARARSGVAGPVFVECPIDLLYDETIAREWFAQATAPRSRSLRARVEAAYVRRYVERIFAWNDRIVIRDPAEVAPLRAGDADVAKAAVALRDSKRPLLVVGSQALSDPTAAADVGGAIERLGGPVYLAGLPRGLLGGDHRLQMRHNRRRALKESDLVILAGVPSDFRLNYGRDIGRATLIGVNRNARDLKVNRRPDIAIHADSGLFLRALADRARASNRDEWIARLRESDKEREREIEKKCDEPSDGMNPLALCRAIESSLASDSILVADGGDFVSTASYVVRPRAPLSWLDPGAFGTLGVGAGFAIAAKLARPQSEVWILYGDGSVGFTIAEFDTLVRHKLPVIAIVGNDACWTQIAREQVEILGDDTGVMLRRTDYHIAVEGLGAKGLLLERIEDADRVLREAKSIAASGTPVLVNAMIGRTDFRKGAISM